MVTGEYPDLGQYDPGSSPRLPTVDEAANSLASYFNGAIIDDP